MLRMGNSITEQGRGWRRLMECYGSKKENIVGKSKNPQRYTTE